MEKKAKERKTRNDGYQPTAPDLYGYQPHPATHGYRPKPGKKPKPPTTDTNVTKENK